MTLTENRVQMETQRERTSKLNLVESIFYPFLLLNFAITVNYLAWKEDRFTSNASSLTAWQFFFVISSATIWLFPPVKTQNDIYWIFGTLGFELFISVFGMNKWFQSIIYKGRIGSKISKKQNLGMLNTAGIFTMLLISATFLVTVVLKAYWYHTRFFWWNH
jgi:hypothetical protein